MNVPGGTQTYICPSLGLRYGVLAFSGVCASADVSEQQSALTNIDRTARMSQLCLPRAVAEFVDRGTGFVEQRQEQIRHWRPVGKFDVPAAFQLAGSSAQDQI